MRLTEIDAKALARQVAKLDPKKQSKILNRIAGALEISQDPTKNLTRRIIDKVKLIQDPDMAKYYKATAKYMIGNDLSPQEIEKIIRAINTNKCILLYELKKPFNNLANIIPLYAKGSFEIKQYFKDMLMLQPGQGLGPGEILFATHSRELSKEKKGDLTVVATGQDIEVKGGTSSGRFTDRDFGSTTATIEIAKKFAKDYKGIVTYTPKTGTSYAHIIEALKDSNNKQYANGILKALQSSLQSYFGNSNYVKQIIQSVKSYDEAGARQMHGIANMEAYFNAKGGYGGGVLFVKKGPEPPTTAYAETVQSLIKIAKLGVETTYPISHAAAGPFPKIEAISKK